MAITSGKPQCEGYYWMCDINGCEKILHITRRKGGLDLVTNLGWEPIPIDDPHWNNCDWLGPIHGMHEFRRLMDELSEILEVLKPFASIAKFLKDEPDSSIYDSWDVFGEEYDAWDAVHEETTLFRQPIHLPTVGDIRRAAQVYYRAGLIDGNKEDVVRDT